VVALVGVAVSPVGGGVAHGSPLGISADAARPVAPSATVSRGHRGLAVGVPGAPVPAPTGPADVTPTAAASPGTGATSAAPGTVGAASGKVLYLTFDDGPDPHWTPQLLALLARYGITATFFEVGSQVRDHPQTAAAVRAAGQHVGNHTSHHAKLTDLRGARLRAEIHGGVADATCLRPPYGSVDAAVRKAAAAAGQEVVLWTVDTDDWARPGVPAIEHHLLHDVRPGKIVLMHDGGGDRRETLRALRAVLPTLIARGYRFAPVPGC
jgi:peptidoglycan/xylan/chitin deacetylase (PgdA/CDA1 family)